MRTWASMIRDHFHFLWHLIQSPSTCLMYFFPAINSKKFPNKLNTCSRNGSLPSAVGTIRYCSHEPDMNQIEAIWLRSPITSYRYCFSSTDVALHCETTANATKEVFPGRKETVHLSEGMSFFKQSSSWKVCQILSVKDDGAESSVFKCDHPGKSWWPRRRDRVERCMHFWRCQVQTSRLADCRMLGMESHGKSTSAKALLGKQVLATISLLHPIATIHAIPLLTNLVNSK